MLRRDGRTLCKYCGTSIEFFDRYDGTRIPLTPEFPAKKLPTRLRWHVNRGIAYPGRDGISAYCRIPHLAVCPAVDHPDLPDELADVVRLLKRRMHQAIRDGKFIPYKEPNDELEVEHPDPDPAELVRHIVAYFGVLRIGPCLIEDLQCIAEGPSPPERWTLFDCGMARFLLRIFTADLATCPLSDTSFWGKTFPGFVHWREQQIRWKAGRDPFTNEPDPYADMFPR